MTKTALIIGAGKGISGSFAKELASEGYKVCLASRSLKNIDSIASDIGGYAVEVDVSSEESIRNLFKKFQKMLGVPDVVLYNPSKRLKGGICDLDISATREAIDVTAFGALVAAQEASKRMIPVGKGAIFFTGATASIKGFAHSSVFAMGKFALRGLSQSLYRELSPLGIHVAHFIIDGVVKKSDLVENSDDFTSAAIAKTFIAVLKQPKQAWSLEIELRPSSEKF